MKVSQIVFSPTGGTERVADIITDEWGIPVNKIDLTNAEKDCSEISLKKEDIAVLCPKNFRKNKRQCSGRCSTPNPGKLSL